MLTNSKIIQLAGKSIFGNAVLENIKTGEISLYESPPRYRSGQGLMIKRLTRPGWMFIDDLKEPVE